MTSEVHAALAEHLLRLDGQEDLCFALWRPSTGATRISAVVCEVILPRDGERHVHGNVSWTADYFMRALEEAMDRGCGLAVLHSHPLGTGWQGMSPDDVDAESRHAPQTWGATELPLLGLTLASDKTWSARMWTRRGPGAFDAEWCDTIRAVGERLQVSSNPATSSGFTSPSQVRTVSAWGDDTQRTIAGLRVGIIGAGSVGALVAEALARTGVGHITLMDFDSIEEINLDRLVHATKLDALLCRSKVERLRRALRRAATHPSFVVDALECSVIEPDGLAAALDCDILFSCVDRPWPRQRLNLIANAHLIPVIDGGIAIDRHRDGRMAAAHWRAHVVAPCRACMSCLRQFVDADAALEESGALDTPSYIEALPEDHLLRRRENVFAFSMATASLEVLQMLSMVVAPSGMADVGAFHQHFVTGELECEDATCVPGCYYSGPSVVARADHLAVPLSSPHPVAELARDLRRISRSRLRVRGFEWAARLGHRATGWLARRMLGAPRA